MLKKTTKKKGQPILENKTLKNEIPNEVATPEDKRAKYPFEDEFFDTVRDLVDRNDIERSVDLIAERLKRHHQSGAAKEKTIATGKRTNTYFVSYYYAKESDLPDSDKGIDTTRAFFSKIGSNSDEPVGLESFIFQTAETIDTQEKLLAFIEAIKKGNRYKDVVIISLSLLAAK